MPPAPDTALRRSPRVTADGSVQLHGQGKIPIQRSEIVNVSEGGALLLASMKQAEGTILQVELSAPIFAESTLLTSRVAHCVVAPQEMAERFNAAKKPVQTYLIGVEFTQLTADQSKQLRQFVHQRLSEERRQRGANRRTARDRAKTPRAVVPAWAYALGLFVGAFVALRGILDGQSDTAIATRVMAALVGSWCIGRIAIEVWLTLERWHTPLTNHPTMALHGADPLSDADSDLLETKERPIPVGTGPPPPMAAQAVPPSNATKRLPSPTEDVSADQAIAA